MSKGSPLITYYARVINNLNGNIIMNYVNVNENNIWYYGRCNASKDGGESEYIVEFDIWNNEPAFRAGTRHVPCHDAVNCKFTVYSEYDDENGEYFVRKDDVVEKGYIHARCSNNYKLSDGQLLEQVDFKPIKGLFRSVDVTGNVGSNRLGVLSGEGDHAIVQTKIVIPKDHNIDNIPQVFNFIFNFSYEFKGN